MKILFITPYSPLENWCGGCIRTGFTWRALCEMGEVHTIVLSDRQPKCRPCDDDRIRFVKYGTAFRFPVKWYLVAAFSWMPFFRDVLYCSRREVLELLELEESDFDCVVVHYMGTLSHTAAWEIAPCYLDIDDLPSQKLTTLQVPKMSRIGGWVLVILAKIWQAFLLRQCAAFWVCNPEQGKELECFGRCGYLPNIANPPPENYDFNFIGDMRFLTVGRMAYPPNCEGVDWFLDSVWPKIKDRYPDAVYDIVGSGIPDWMKNKWSSMPGVKIHGFVDNLAPLYQAASFVVAPIFSGAGTAIKVLEAALFGRKILATPFAARGIDATQCLRFGISICSTSKMMIEAVDDFNALSNDEKRRRQKQWGAAAYASVSFSTYSHAVQDVISVNG